MSKQAAMRKVSTPSAADLLGPYLDQQCRVLQEVTAELQSALTRRSDRLAVPAERVHDGRVACRRLRSTIKVYDRFLSGPSAARLTEEAGWLATRLGAVRDLDVVGDRIGAALEQLEDDLVLHDAKQELAAQLAYRRQIALAELRDAVHHQTYADLVDQLDRWRERPPVAGQAPATKIKKAVKQAERQLSRRLRTAALALSADDPEAGDLVHAARRAGKRLRYASEAALPILGPHATDRLNSFIALQDELGDYQDSRVASVLLRDLGGIPGRNGFTFGLLYAQEAEHRRRLGKKIVKRARGL
jgi:CHAD domain-containing protein